MNRLKGKRTQKYNKTWNSSGAHSKFYTLWRMNE